MLYYLKSDSIISNSRLLKYIDFIKASNIPYHVLGWNRSGESLPKSNEIDYYNRLSGYQTGGFKAVKGRICWIIYVIKYLFEHRSDITVIHACDLDAAFPAAVFNFFSREKKKIIFDVFDWFSDNIINQNAVVRKAFLFMEWFSIKMADEVIICEPERIQQIPYQLNRDVVVLPNIPSFTDDSFLKNDGAYTFDNNLKTFAYVGGFTSDRCLNELLDLAENRKVNLLIAGFGITEIEDRCRALNTSHDNVKYYGKVDYKTALKIQFNADVIFAMYQKISRNNIFAAPNKYYESMFLGKPIISTKGTILERKILDNEIGYVVEEDYAEIAILTDKLVLEDMRVKGENAKRLWIQKYKYFTHDFLNGAYRDLIRE